MTSLNQQIFLFVHQFAGRSFLLDYLVIFLAQYLAYILVAAFLVLIYFQAGTARKFYIFAEGAISVMLARGLVTEIIRFFYHHERPFSFYNFAPLISGDGWSFPSGHMAWFFALSLTVWFVNKKWGAWFFGLSILMGLARIYAGIHWPLDIVGGMAVGTLSTLVVRAFFKESREKIFARPLAKSPEIQKTSEASLV